ncbi:threonylcarbamoyl-AMP synthase [Candidatus Micrarchaeota archaeon]|nr:threonylcarbamoyl-AMP synthase [Candidatus Micrarchaeota archaeon]MBI5177412.1 threonylcarbamoyl-AMP synthase [Candidatus Micrarchaeota archaeon]
MEGERMVVKMAKTKIMQASRQERPKAERTIDAAVKMLEAGGLVVIPTETSYGIAADATDEAAIRRVFELKERDSAKPFPVIVGDIHAAMEYLELGETAIRLSAAFHPGPLNIIVEKKPAIPDALSTTGVAFRISSNYFANAIAGRLGRPITATSANKSGEPPIYQPYPVRELFGGKVEGIIDTGELLHNPASTVVDSRVSPPLILRQGVITQADILRALG